MEICPYCRMQVHGSDPRTEWFSDQLYHRACFRLKEQKEMDEVYAKGRADGLAEAATAQISTTRWDFWKIVAIAAGTWALACSIVLWRLCE